MHGTRQPLGAKKHFGQHFLRDATVIEKILEAIPWEKGEKIVEVGPGRGALTRPLYEQLQKKERAQDGIAVELDEELIPELREEFPKMQVVHADAVKVDWKEQVEGKPWILVGNLPYNAGTAIVNEAFWGSHPPVAAIVMLQKEVGERMIATPPNMSLLSLAMQLKTEGKRVCTVKPGAFVPPPKVDSIVIALAYKEKCTEAQAKKIMSLAKRGFAHPRKQLKQTLALKGVWEKEAVGIALEKCGVSAQARPEELSWQAWAALAEY